jgi:hypothetical protein
VCDTVFTRGPWSLCPPCRLDAWHDCLFCCPSRLPARRDSEWGGTDSRTESPARNGPAQPYPCCRVSGKWLPAWHQLTSIATRALPCQLVVTTVVTGAPSIPGCHRRRVVAVKQRVHDGFRFVRIAPPGRCVVVRADGAYGG